MKGYDHDTAKTHPDDSGCNSDMAGHGGYLDGGCPYGYRSDNLAAGRPGRVDRFGPCQAGGGRTAPLHRGRQTGVRSIQPSGSAATCAGRGAASGHQADRNTRPACPGCHRDVDYSLDYEFERLQDFGEADQTRPLLHRPARRVLHHDTHKRTTESGLWLLKERPPSNGQVRPLSR